MPNSKIELALAIFLEPATASTAEPAPPYFPQPSGFASPSLTNNTLWAADSTRQSGSENAIPSLRKFSEPLAEQD
jgi:hypothetical protein